MEYAEVKQYLDNLVEIHKEASKMHHLNSQIRASLNANTILVYEGIEIIADVMGLKLVEEELSPDRVNKYEYSFDYKDVKFVAYTKERLEDFTNEHV